MKASKIFLSALLLMTVVSASARDEEGFSYDDNSDFNRVYGSFTMGKMKYNESAATSAANSYSLLRNFDRSSINPFGGSLGYTHAFNLAGRQYPVYLEVGGEVNYQHRKIVYFKDTPDTHMAEDLKQHTYLYRKENHITADFLSIAIPVNVTYLFSFADGKMAIAPFIGFNFKCNLMGKQKMSLMNVNYEDGEQVGTANLKTRNDNFFKRESIDPDDASSKQDYNARRFQFGLNLGLNYYWNRWMIGYRFQPDFTRYRDVEADQDERLGQTMTSNCHYFSVGYCF